MNRCDMCGADGEIGCDELFQRLLALDHSRQEPWGPLHGVVVACYRLQHERLGDTDRDFPTSLLRAFVDDGLEATWRLTERARRGNSHRNTRREVKTTAATRTPGPTAATVTIADVAVDGTFPADGHADRVRAWAEAALAAQSSR